MLPCQAPLASCGAFVRRLGRNVGASVAGRPSVDEERG
jgi:hypothetical protein